MLSRASKRHLSFVFATAAVCEEVKRLGSNSRPYCLSKLSSGYKELYYSSTSTLIISQWWSMNRPLTWSLLSATSAFWVFTAMTIDSERHLWSLQHIHNTRMLKHIQATHLQNRSHDSIQAIQSHSDLHSPNKGNVELCSQNNSLH